MEFNMIQYNDVEQIKKLIKKGFDPELISFELDIPIEKVKQCELELELETSKKLNLSKNYSDREKNKSKNKQARSEMELMRERYKKLFFQGNQIEVEI